MLQALWYYRRAMVLFLLFSLPLLYLMVLSLPWDSWKRPEAMVLVSTLFKGALMFFPGYLVIVILRGIVGFSYSGVLLYLSLFLRDQFFPLLVALAAFYLLRKKLAVATSEEGVFLVVFSFVCGFLALVNVTDVLRSWGTWDASTLFLLPATRVAQTLIVALLARRYYPWEGREAAYYGTAALVVAAVLTLSSFLLIVNRPTWAILLTVASVAGALIGFSLRFPKAVRG